MRKTELADRIVEETGIHKADVLVILDTYFKEVKDSLIKGESLTFRGFGSFILKRRLAKHARIITRGVSITVPEHIIPAFKPAKEFKAAAMNSRPKRVWKYERKANPEGK
jgi:DNA-binding protein HU-beta